MKLFEILEKWRIASWMKMATFNHIIQNYYRCCFSIDLKWGSIPTYTTDEDYVNDIVDCNTSGMPCLIAPLLPRIETTARCMTR